MRAKSGCQPIPDDEALRRKENQSLIRAILNSKIYQTYEAAFTQATGLPVSLRPIEAWQLPLHGKANENPLCAAMAGGSRTCAYCLQVQQELTERARKEPHTIVCEMGLNCAAVPVCLGDRIIGFLQSGQVLSKAPTEQEFERSLRKLGECRSKINPGELRKLFFESKVVSPMQYDAMIRLLGVFAEHLSIICNQILFRKQNSEPVAVQKAREYIQEKQSEDLSLGEVAKAVNTSVFHFCKMFRKATGLTFTDYVSHVRVEKAKNLLLNPNLRISEIAYEVGFQSLTHFNRVFKKITGESPSHYREKLALP